MILPNYFIEDEAEEFYDEEEEDEDEYNIGESNFILSRGRGRGQRGRGRGKGRGGGRNRERDYRKVYSVKVRVTSDSGFYPTIKELKEEFKGIKNCRKKFIRKGIYVHGFLNFK